LLFNSGKPLGNRSEVFNKHLQYIQGRRRWDAGLLAGVRLKPEATLPREGLFFSPTLVLAGVAGVKLVAQWGTAKETLKGLAADLPAVKLP
jgi:hypothetical protein